MVLTEEERSAAQAAVPGRTRLHGVDLARGLAVLGMFVAHAGPAVLAPDAGSAAEFLASLGNGHASILFATLAGVSLALLTGGSRPHEGLALRRDRVRVAVRAVVLFLLGMVLTQLGAPMMVILSFYALYFLLALPFLRVRPAVLAVLAAVWAVAGPVVSFVVRSALPGSGSTAGGALSFTDLTSWDTAVAGVQRLLLDGAYPVITWMPFVFAGLAVGRLDLRSTAVRLRLLVTGVVLTVVGAGGSWLALHVFGGVRALQPVLDRLAPIAAQVGEDPLDLLQQLGFGVAPTTTPATLLLNAPHTGTPFEIVTSTGAALAVLALCLVAGDHLRVLLAPLAAVGALALTVYVVQGLVLGAVVEGLGEQPWLPLLVLALGSLVLCGVWRPLLGRGPLERVLHWASTRTADVVVR
ncbi:heparan-alpha-glucosaminide N-acetyltransferase domain-containing protein [Saccharopolyspora hordei]|uniref:Putative membrane protein YeiB n=1 Tax=Saccharopolyspora hordei TaxID=1838 RepID=A0A853AL48_9PSEU|nr:heparan-alpha-glucosaminide N-acetyltransferase domain-containing protein [Saccharopolyspora hordei]NYI85452.1 putative membrane protein YeiB [Saccharopolyspora hordei]